MAGVSNADIMSAISQLTTEVAVVRTIAEATKAQAEKTNGRVTKVEEWKNAIQAVDEFKKDHPTQVISAPNATTVNVQPQKWFQSKELVGGVVAVLIALATVIYFFAGVPKP